MTRLRRPTIRRRFSMPDEDRQTFLVNLGFVAIIVALLALLAGVVGWTYYVQNLRAVASVGGVDIRPDMVVDRQELARLRIDREERRLREALVAGEIDQQTKAEREEQLRAELNELEASAEENLIDLIFQSQLAAERGITVSDADVDARQAQQLAGVERRRVQMVVIETEAEEEGSPTFGEREQARLRAEEALAALQAGATFAEVAEQYGTDQSAAPGGELGLISSFSSVDDAFREELFELDEGALSGVIRGADDAYRIGRVTEVVRAGEEHGFQDRVLESMSLERYRQFLRWEVIAERLREDVNEELLGGDVEQLRLSHIRIDASEAGEGEDDEGEVHYSEILFAPNDQPDEATDLPEDDPAWDAARVEAEQAFAELDAITDPEQLATRFAELATEKSDALSAEDGGDAGFVGRDLLPEELGNTRFDEEHAEGDLLGPVRDENGYYVLLFHQRRAPAAERLAALKTAIEQPNPDWPALVAQFSDDEQSKREDGDIGWWTRTMLNQVDAELADKLYGLAQGEISEPVELGNATHVFFIAQKTQRELDADQSWFLSTNNAAFEEWYGEKKQAAEDADVIVRAGQEEDEPGVDFPDEELPDEAP